MGNDEACSSACQAVHGFLNQDLCSCINITCRLVENQHRSILRHRPRNRDQLLLSGGESALLLNLCIKTLRQRGYKVAQVCLFENLLESVLIHILQIIDDVLSERSIDHPGLLEDHAEDASQLPP